MPLINPSPFRSFLVATQPPPEEQTHGAVQGYYVGYRVRGSGQPYSYKTLQSGPSQQECHLRDLQVRTRYGVVVQAFNAMGAGPASEEVAAQTLDFDPPGAPRLKLVSSTSSSIHLSWDVAKDQPIDGCLLFYKAEPGPVPRAHAPPGASTDWSSVQAEPDRRTHAFRGLGCGRTYAFYAMAFNAAGRGPRSNVVLAKTDGSVPVAPDARDFIAANVSSAIFRLSSWRSGGCPISSFTVLYKRQSSPDDWKPAATSLVPEPALSLQPQLSIDDLEPGTWYQLLVTAQNEAGATEAEYVFATLTPEGGTVPPPHWTQVIESQRRRIHVIVPVVCAVVVTLLVAVVVGCTVSRRRLAALRRRRLLWQPANTGEASSMTTKSVDTVPMSVWKKAGFQQSSTVPRTEKLYWPSPFRSRAPSCAVSASGDGARCNTWASPHCLATIHEDCKMERETLPVQKQENAYAVPFAPSNTVLKLEERDDLLASAERLAASMSLRKGFATAVATEAPSATLSAGAEIQNEAESR